MPRPCSAHAALIHTCRAAPLPCRVLRESPRGSRKNPNCQSSGLTAPCLKSVAATLLLIHDRRCLGVSPQLQFNGRVMSFLGNNLRETPPVSRKKPNVGRLLTGRREAADVNSHMPCRSPAAPVPWPCEVAFEAAWQGNGTGAAWHV
jgi:hypothetical protein